MKALLVFGALSAAFALVVPESEANVARPAIAADAWPAQDKVVEISATKRAERAQIIREAAKVAGLTNAALIAGIGEVETNFAHCWSEATWACKGPASSSCNGGPVIAGSADGPCVKKQGGLGLFQFDAGDYSDTIEEYGPSIVTMAGNVEAVVPFLTVRAVQSVAGVDSEEEALQWMNSITIADGDPEFEKWLYFISWRYNGCKGCTSQQNKYRAGTHALVEEMGEDFWNSSQLEDCPLVAATGGLLEEDGACFQTRGPSHFFRSEDSGHGDALLWTKATASATPANTGIWNVHVETPGLYEIEAFCSDTFGQSEQAKYKVEHEGGSEHVVINQSEGQWVSLGEFALQSDVFYKVELNDNTGESWAPDPGGVKLVYDAIRVMPAGGANPDSLGPDSANNSGKVGACSQSGRGASWWIVVSLVALGLGRRRSRKLVS